MFARMIIICPNPFACRVLWLPILFVTFTDLLTAGDNFVERVVPILEHRCLHCHNDQDNKGGFSLQTAATALAEDYVVAGDSANSYLVELITPIDGQAEMPKGAMSLSDDEIQTIRQWIDQGAAWPEALQLEAAKVNDFSWWSYQPLSRPAVPDFKALPADVLSSVSTSQTGHDWSQNPVDAFILEKLVEQGLTPSVPADPRSLIRRLTFDLTGLPPTPEEVEQFANDADPHAYQRLVDRLLDSPRYGERWARHWLDVVKYADTCGYDKDKLRPHAWPYRDYVIRAFNTDKPYSRFVQEQLAGDQLFPGDPDGILGLGFIAAGPWDFIGHVEVPESKIDGKVARNLDRDDMVSNALNTFSSTTIQCARCHNHKFDPISQADYYGVQALFAAVDRAPRPYDTDPAIEQRRQELNALVTKTREQLEALHDEIAEAGGARLAELNLTIDRLSKQVELVKQPAHGYHSQIVAEPQTTKSVTVDLGSNQPLEQIVLQPCHDDFAGIGAGFGFPLRFKVEVAADQPGTADQPAREQQPPDERTWVMVADQSESDWTNRGLQPFVSAGLGMDVRWIRVTATKLAERSQDYIFALAELRAVGADGAELAIGCQVLASDSIEAPERWSRANLTDGKWPHYGDAAVAEALVLATVSRAEILRLVETPARQQRRSELAEQMAAAERELQSLPPGRLVYAATTQFAPQGNFKPTGGQPRDVQVLHRGEVTQPLQPAVPGVLPLGDDFAWQLSPSASDGERRAALARWLTRKDHPQVWRSIVNRVWQYHFGVGIVSTPNDFGKMGALPTHPQLLDWLACEFRDGGQSFKQLHRLIVNSAAYRQASMYDPAKAKIDGGNRYLWRMNRRRLTAEEIRDSILVVSGTLDLKMGGPGYYLFGLEKTEHSPHFQYHKFNYADPSSHRRSIYRFIVRSQPDPWMTTLDCADSSQSTPKREETLTALQALSLLNNQFNLVMADRFAERLDAERLTLRDKVRDAFRLVVQRQPAQGELDDLVTYADRHGLANLCRILFNLSEFVFID
ncbi:DUF1553 domain-containing protein [Planctomycetaceae bacterium SH139]